MTGRGTVIECFEAIKRPGQEPTLAVKIYWPEAHRPTENMFIYDARVAAKGDSDILNHLPTVFASQVSHNNTSYIRMALGRETGKPRLMRCIAFAYLDPIVKLSNEAFVIFTPARPPRITAVAITLGGSPSAIIAIAPAARRRFHPLLSSSLRAYFSLCIFAFPCYPTLIPVPSHLYFRQ
jgi:hypothetical protein